MRPLLIFGASGLGQEAVWVAEEMNATLPAPERWHVLGYLDDDPEKKGACLYDYVTLGGPEAAGAEAGSDLYYVCAVANAVQREEITSRLDALGWRAATLVHPSVIRARHVEIGAGTYVAPGSIISPNATIGRHVIVNQRVSIGHDAVLEDFSQVCPGAQINGGCRIGRGALVGSNASIHQERVVGEYAVVGANAQVVRSVEPHTSVVGVPARVLASARLTAERKLQV